MDLRSDTLEKLGELPGLHGYAEHLTLNADGTTLAAENESDGIRIYDVPSRSQLGETIPYVDGALGYFAMRPDGLELAIPYGDLGLVLWDLDPQHWLDAACSLAGRNLSPQEWDNTSVPSASTTRVATETSSTRRSQAVLDGAMAGVDRRQLASTPLVRRRVRPASTPRRTARVRLARRMASLCHRWVAIRRPVPSS